MSSSNIEQESESTSHSRSLHKVLLDLHDHPYPYVPNPSNCKKRASVALILRIRPVYSHWPKDSKTTSEAASRSGATQLDHFFSQAWVEHGDPEVLFIKRASRVGDRWTGHVALPGGKRDPEDEDDKAAAIREVSEEIGLDLKTRDCLFVGNLPERVVTTSWGKLPLMVLCPYIFILTGHDVPSLRLQPTEVASAHWVPLRALLSPHLRTVENVDVSDRMASQRGFIARAILRIMLGRMMFSAVRLIPTESLHCSSIPGFISEDSSQDSSSSLAHWFTSSLRSQPGASASTEKPLLLWGLTLGILADFLNELPPHNAVYLWKYPTFTTPDLRWLLSMISYSLRKRNLQRLNSGDGLNQTAVDSHTAAIAVPTQSRSDQENIVEGIGGRGVRSYYGQVSHTDPRYQSHAVGVMLDGYYDRVQLAIAVFLAIRGILGSAAILFLIRWLKRR